MQIQPASVGCKVNPFSYVVTMLKLVRNNRGAFFGMVIGQMLFTSPSSQMRAVDIAFIIPLIVYLFMTFTGKFKAKKQDE